MIIHKTWNVAVVMLLLVEMFDCLPKARVPTKNISKSRSCECSLFLKEDLWLPKHQVMELTNDYKVDCTDLGGAVEKCKTYCADEVAALNSLYDTDPSVLRDYPPSQSIPCNHAPTDTVSFAKICGSQSYVLTSTLSGPPICCDSSSSRIWCGSTGFAGWFGSFGNANSISHIAEGRKLNLQKDQNDESHNEIDDSSSDSDSKPGKKKQETPYLTSGSKSWMYTVLKYFGYSTFSDVVKGIDIFSLPVGIQSAVRTYKDEVSLGRCYMEFTTFKVFTKQESPFEGLLRKKRSSTFDGPITRFDEFIDPEVSLSEGPKMMPFDGDTIKNLVNGFAGVLQRSDSTKQYGDMLSSFLPIVTQLITGGSADVAPSPMSLLFKFAGPLLSQMNSPKPSPNSIHDPIAKVPQKQSWPNAGPSSSPASSPLSSMAMNMLGNVISNFFSSPGANNRIETPAQITTRPTKPSTTPAPAGDMTSVIRNLAQLFLQGAAGSTPVARPIETPKPIVESTSEKDSNLSASEREEKRFLHMLLQVIRPIFISIVGNTPGENGVKEIRKMSTLSTMGRVDDTLREAVDSPLFCFKKYLVNKAWSITENGVRTVVSTFTPEEQARMMKSVVSPK